MNTNTLPAYYERIKDAGSDAPWLTLVHGASQHRGLFSAQVAEFRERFRLLLIDLPGHGGSQGLDGPYGQLEYADAVGRVIELAGAWGGHYWGTHTGAAVALLLCCRGGARFRSLVLEGVVMPGEDLGSVTEAYSQASRTARTHGMPRAREEWLQGKWFAAQRAQPERCRAAAYRDLTDEFEGRPWTDLGVPRSAAPLWAELEVIDCPVLLINGERDVGDFLELAGRIRARLPSATAITIAGGTGFPLWEFPVEVNAAVAAFFNDLGAAQGGGAYTDCSPDTPDSR